MCIDIKSSVNQSLINFSFYIKHPYITATHHFQRLRFLFSYLQAKDFATFIQTKKDMGCRANQVQTIEEGVNSQSPDTQQFWAILGGQTAYQCKKLGLKKIGS